MFKSRGFWWTVGILLVLAVAGFIVVPLVLNARSAGAALTLGEVTTITAVRSVEGSGPVAARQISNVSWRTTGTVLETPVSIGDQVTTGQVLMRIDPASAPQNVILAQADLINAQDTLDSLLHPTDLQLANAQKAVVDAEEAVRKAEKDLGYAQNPVSQSLYDAVSDAELSLLTARNNVVLSESDADVNALSNARYITAWYHRRWEGLQAEFDADSGNLDKKAAAERAWIDYQSKLNDQQTLELRIENNQATKDDSLSKAQTRYDQAVANLNAALLGPDASRVAQAQARLVVAQAQLADAQDKLDQLQNGPDSDQIRAAEARVQAAQATVDSLILLAPFAGEVLEVNFQTGDQASQAQAAVVIADRTELHVDVAVDETDIGQVVSGAQTTLTFDAAPGLVLTGTVERINPVGQSVQGLVKYTVRVSVPGGDPRVLLGMTANVSIIVSVTENALAVPLDAVQLDDQGEFVSRLKPGVDPVSLANPAPGSQRPGLLFRRPGAAAGDGADLFSEYFERVPVVSGEVQGDLVLVTGGLQPGDTLRLVTPQPTTSGSPFGPG